MFSVKASLSLAYKAGQICDVLEELEHSKYGLKIILHNDFFPSHVPQFVEHKGKPKYVSNALNLPENNY